MEMIRIHDPSYFLTEMGAWRVLVVWLLVPCCWAAVFYVDSAAHRTTDCGTSWDTACATLGSGVAAACQSSSSPRELLVGPGRYSFEDLGEICLLSIRSVLPFLFFQVRLEIHIEGGK